MNMERLYWLGQAPEFDHIDETLETDVIVCGAGIAGVSAARAAVEDGAECILFEKAKRAQARSGQFGVIGGSFLKRWGVDNTDKKNEIVNYLMRYSNYRVKQGILKYFVEHIGEDFDWYAEGIPEGTYIADDLRSASPEGTRLRCILMHLPFRPGYDGSKERFPIYPYTIMFAPGHDPVMQNNLKLAQDTGRLTCFFKTPAKKLLRDDRGRVYGVIAQDYDGKVIQATARRGVVLATGDYSGDRDMLEFYCPQVADNPCIPMGLAPDRQPINTGDGHRMGMWIGAKMEAGPHATNNHNMGGAMGVTPFLLLDVHGKRFINEDCPGQQVENALSHVKDRTAWQFFDSAWPEQIPFMPCGHASCTKIVDQQAVAEGRDYADYAPRDGFASQSVIDQAVEKGEGTFKADTLEELIEKIGLPMEETLASIRRYNDLARRGEDEDFGKPAQRMFALEHGPYYATRFTASPLLCCHGGLESDELCHCFDEAMDPIPGLYVCGNVQGNRFSVDYPTLLPGCSHSIALCLGRRAGLSAARGE